jgi:glycosyltransferase involved in cell wall biosynthesis
MLISIITVTHNADKTLGKLLAETAQVLSKYADVEHVIVDGASADKTVEMIKAYSRLSPNINFVSEPDTGIYNAMNKGIDLASGEYIIHLNGDDWISDLAILDELHDYLLRKKPIILSTPVQIYDGDRLYRTLPAKPINAFHAKFGFHFPHQGTFFSRKLFQQVGGYNEKIGYIADKIFGFQVLDVLPASALHAINKVAFAQSAGGVSSRSSLTPLKTFVLTIQSTKQVQFKHPMSRAIFNLFFKLWMLLGFK